MADKTQTLKSHVPLDLITLTCMLLLGLASLGIMRILSTTEIPDFRNPHLFALQSAWLGIGAVTAIGTYFLCRSFARPTAVLTTALLTVAVAFAIFKNDRAHGIPYLKIGPLWINIIEAGCMASLAPVAALISGARRSVWIYGLTLVPLIFAMGYGSTNGAFCYSLALASMLALRMNNAFSTAILAKTKLGMITLLCFVGTAGVIKNIGFSTESNPGLVLYDTVLGANAHTELVFSHLATQFGLAVALGVVIVLFALVGRLLWLFVDTRFTLPMGFGVFIIAQTALELLVSAGLLPNPPSGVSLPFVSFSGSLLLVQMALIGAILGLRSTHSAFISTKQPVSSETMALANTTRPEF